MNCTWQFDSVLFDPASGAVFFAVAGHGAYAGAAFEVRTSETTQVSGAQLCESAEALFGNREVTARVALTLVVTKAFILIDGQL